MIEPNVEDIPKQVRIRTDPEAGYAKRYKAIHQLQHITGENKTASIIRAVRFYNRMHGVATAGAFDELLEAAEEQGSLTGAEIAEILDAPELPVEYETEFTVGGVDE